MLLPSKPGNVICSLWNLVLSQSQLLQTGMWKRKLEAEAVEAVKFLWKRKQKHFDKRDWKWKQTRKRLILSGAGSGSKKLQRWGSGSDLGSMKLQEEQEAEALKIWLLPHPCLEVTQHVAKPTTMQPVDLSSTSALDYNFSLITLLRFFFADNA